MSTKQENGVFYSRDNYAGLFRRMIIAIIDIGVLILTFIGLAFCWFYINPELETLPDSFIWFIIAIAYIYLSLMKPSKIKTLGYLITGVKIVNLKGEKPTISQMTIRYLLLLAGPLGIWLDIAWMLGEYSRQTFRDKYVGTYVVKKDAEPKGTGLQTVTNRNILGWHLMFREVERM